MLCILLFPALIASGCSGTAGSEDRTEGSRLQVVATVFPQYDFARQIAGDSADVYMLLKPGEEVHSYEPTPQDIRMIQKSDLFIYTGGENDVWAEKILGSPGAETGGPRTVRLVDLVDTCAEEPLEGMMPERGENGHSHGLEEEMEEEHDHGHESGEAPVTEEEHDHDHASPAAEVTGIHRHVHGGEPDEHVWTSPENCVKLIEKLTDEFCGADPAHAEEYRANGGSCCEAFKELDAQYLEMAASARRKTLLFGDRFPFRYLAEELGLTCYAAFSGCSAESEPSAATIAFLIDKAAEERLPVVFQIEFSNGHIARAVSEAAQAKMEKSAAEQTEDPAGSAPEVPKIQVLQLHSCHNLTRDEFAAGETCLSLMKKNLEALRTALDA